MNKPELLAPAGNIEKLKIAFKYGADAVYIGGRNYSLRANASNFNINDIKEAVDIAHHQHKKLYVTVNIILHNEDLEGLDVYLKQLEKIKVDAIIIADPVIIDIIKENNINLEIHLSTQQSTINYKAINFWKNEGVSRIVLAREASKEEIKENLQKGQCEIETFIHGSMCMGYSGRCQLSSFMVNRDANRGGCAQNCRWDYTLLDQNKKIVNEAPFSMKTKDLCMLNHIKELMKMGVSSLKIEGRMRSIHYIGTTVNLYRKLIDNIYQDNNYKIKPWYQQEVNRAANREYAVQNFDKYPTHQEQYYNDREEQPTKEFIGILLDTSQNLIKVEQRNYFKVGDIIEVFGPNTKNQEFIVKQIYNEQKKSIDVARHPREILYLNIPFSVEKDDMLRMKNKEEI